MIDLHGELLSGLATGRRLPSRLLAGALIVLCVLLAVQALRIGNADIYRYQVLRDLKRWEMSGAVPDLGKWVRAESYNRRSLAIDPTNSVYWYHAARLREWRFQVVGDFPENPAEIGRQALDYQRHAVRMRPTWPIAWAQLAMLKARQGELDAEFRRAAERSLALGPWEPAVHVLLVDIGMMLWPSLTAEIKSVVLVAFERKMTIQEGLESWVDYLQTRPDFRSLCSRARLDQMQERAREACEEARLHAAKRSIVPPDESR